MTERRAVVIVGGGPAAYSAAIYAARANLRPLCIEGYASGGMLMTTGVVENYPGFAEPVTGPEIMLAMREQAERFGCELVAKDVNHVDLSTWPFRVSYRDELASMGVMVTPAVIIDDRAVPGFRPNTVSELLAS
jgi:thioredoxin reductase (NADPH)